jgi:hypothetical protein
MTNPCDSCSYDCNQGRRCPLRKERAIDPLAVKAFVIQLVRLARGSAKPAPRK